MLGCWRHAGNGWMGNLLSAQKRAEVKELLHGLVLHLSLCMVFSPPSALIACPCVSMYGAHKPLRLRNSSEALTIRQSRGQPLVCVSLATFNRMLLKWGLPWLPNRKMKMSWFNLSAKEINQRTSHNMMALSNRNRYVNTVSSTLIRPIVFTRFSQTNHHRLLSVVGKRAKV